MERTIRTKYDVFLSHSHKDADVVENLAKKLEDNVGLKVWLDKWILIPGEPFIQAMSKGLDETKTCAVFIGNETPKGWFAEEIGKALNKQSRDHTFRVIPVLLPNSDSSFINDFLELRTWVDFRENINDPKSFHLLTCGVQGIPPGRFDDRSTCEQNNEKKIRQKLLKLNQLHNDKLIDITIKLEYQRILLNKLIIEDEK